MFLPRVIKHDEKRSTLEDSRNYTKATGYDLVFGSYYVDYWEIYLSTSEFRVFIILTKSQAAT